MLSRVLENSDRLAMAQPGQFNAVDLDQQVAPLQALVLAQYAHGLDVLHEHGEIPSHPRHASGDNDAETFIRRFLERYHLGKPELIPMPATDMNY